MDQGNGRKSKLRWHCGLCNVSCKDANGFKCHLQCESHLMREEAGHAKTRYRIDEPSRQFAKSFMDLLLKQYDRILDTCLASTDDMTRQVLPATRPGARRVRVAVPR